MLPFGLCPLLRGCHSEISGIATSLEREPQMNSAHAPTQPQARARARAGARALHSVQVQVPPGIVAGTNHWNYRLCCFHTQ